jgi:hypothetical protein
MLTWSTERAGRQGEPRRGEPFLSPSLFLSFSPFFSALSSRLLFLSTALGAFPRTPVFLWAAAQARFFLGLPRFGLGPPGCGSGAAELELLEEASTFTS